jgi:hypothetical protein
MFLDEIYTPNLTEQWRNLDGLRHYSDVLRSNLDRI